MLANIRTWIFENVDFVLSVNFSAKALLLMIVNVLVKLAPNWFIGKLAPNQSFPHIYMSWLNNACGWLFDWLVILNSYLVFDEHIVSARFRLVGLEAYLY